MVQDGGQSTIGFGRWRPVGAGLVMVAILVVIGVVVLSGPDEGGAGDFQSDNGVRVQGVAETREVLAGVPQDGTLLGRPDAPVTIHEFTDLNCPACRQHTVSRLRRLVDDLVRTGKANLRLHLLNLVDPNVGTSDGAVARRAADNFSASDRFWPFVLMVFYNQGSEATEWASEMRLRDIASAAPGVGQGMLSTDETPVTRRADRSAERRATAWGVKGVPAFFVQPRGTVEHVAAGNTDEGLPEAVAAATKRAKP